VSDTPTDTTTLPNIVRPSYNDLRSADDAGDNDDDDSVQDSSSQSQVNITTGSI